MGVSVAAVYSGDAQQLPSSREVGFWTTPPTGRQSVESQCPGSGALYAYTIKEYAHTIKVSEK
jgi:hypothetical protein